MAICFPDDRLTFMLEKSTRTSPKRAVSPGLIALLFRGELTRAASSSKVNGRTRARTDTETGSERGGSAKVAPLLKVISIGMPSDWKTWPKISLRAKSGKDPPMFSAGDVETAK